MWYLVEQYRPGASVDELRVATAHLADAVAALAAGGRKLRFTGASYVSAEESCFCRFESDFIDAVRTACEQARFPYDRILLTDDIDASAERSGRTP